MQAIAETKEALKRHSLWVDVFIRLAKEKPLGMIGLILVLVLFCTGIFAEFLAPYPPNATNISNTMAAPSTSHLLGTDNLGRDLLSRLIYGARISMIIGLGATAMQAVISTAIGLFSGFMGGKIDLIIQRFIDAWICFPGLVILITLRSIVGPGMIQLILILGITGGLSSVRFMRGLTLSIKENLYVQASTAIGAGTGRILWSHLLPNIMPMIIVLFTMSIGGVILAEASLSFLGLGLPLTYPSWGGMISGPGRQYMLANPWLAMWPGIALSLAVFGINMFGDALRDLLDPKLRGGVGGYNLEKSKKAKMKIIGRLTKSKPVNNAQ
jgi:peptide/nickel transport system permease protein